MIRAPLSGGVLGPGPKGAPSRTLSTSVPEAVTDVTFAGPEHRGTVPAGRQGDVRTDADAVIHHLLGVLTRTGLLTVVDEGPDGRLAASCASPP